MKIKNYVIQSSLGSYSFAGINDNHFRKQVETVFIQVTAVTVELLRLELGKGQLEVWKFGNPGPGFFIGRSVQLEYFEDLIYFRISREKRLYFNLHKITVLRKIFIKKEIY